jgi:3-oxosteroid 1-dehydrogenase
VSPLTIAARASAAPVSMHTFDAHTDVVVVGGGGAGLPVAQFSRWAGNEVVLCCVARRSAPGRYDAEDPRFGLTEWEYESFRAIYESASPATELLRGRGADGVDIDTLHRVQRLNLASDGAVTGVEARTPSGEVVHFGARQTVAFATGGFTQDPELRRGFLRRPALGGCAARTTIFIDHQDDRVVSGKLQYNELAQTFFAWDGVTQEFPNLVLIQI